MRICLINPGKEFITPPPLGLAYLASYLRKYSSSKHNIKILDESIKNIEKEILNFKPDLVGITSPTPQIVDAQRISRFIRNHFPKIPIILGGPHISSIPYDKEIYDYFDIGVIGEGEVTFFELVDFFEKSIEHRKLSEINGIVYKNNGKIIATKPRALITNIDSIPFPARDLLDMKYYLKPFDRLVQKGVKKATHMMTSRGCPYNCIFCSSSKIFGRVFRPFSLEYVLNEIKHLIDFYKVDLIYFVDDTFIIDKERIRKLCELILEEGLEFVWSAQLRANLLTEKDLSLLRIMKEAGCFQVEFGFESGSDRVLNLLKAGSVTVEDNQRAIYLCKKVGLKVLGNFMIGTITETEGEIEETKQFILKNKNTIDYISSHVTTPYPGTKLWEMYKEKCKIKNINWKNFWMGEFHNEGYFSDVVSKKKLIKYHKDIRAISYDNLPKSLLVKTAIKRPTIFLKMLIAYISFKLNQRSRME